MSRIPSAARQRVAARAAAPLTGGVKRPMRDNLVLWRDDADTVFRLRLIEVAKMNQNNSLIEYALRGLSHAMQVALVTPSIQGDEDPAWRSRPHPLSLQATDSLEVRDWKRAMTLVQLARDRMHYEEDTLTFDDHVLFFTPIRSGLHLQLLLEENKRNRHVWARFVEFFLNTFQPSRTEELFSPEQCIVVEGRCRIVFEYSAPVPYVRVFKANGGCEDYFIYGMILSSGAKRDPWAELRRLKEDVGAMRL